MEKNIKGIGNYYGGLIIKEEQGKYYWGIANHDDTRFKEIPFSLYLEILKFNRKRKPFNSKVNEKN
jgi:hypothetical protein